MACFLLIVVVAFQLVTASHANEVYQIVVSPDDVLVRHCQTIMVPCVAYFHHDSTDPPTISWMKNGTQLDSTSDSRVTVHPPVPFVKSEMQFVKVVLEVCGVEVGDTGEYSCVLSVGGMKKDRADFEITVTTYDAPTRVIIFPNDTVASSSQTVLLTCVAYGLPLPSITWTRNSHNITAVADSETPVTIETQLIGRGGMRMVRSTLQMCNVHGLLTGEYSCEADNGLTTDSSSFRVTIDDAVHILSGPASTTVWAGDNISLTCNVSSNTIVTWSGAPLTKARRFKVQETVVHEGGVEFVSSVLSVSPVATIDEGVITCTASRGMDKTEHSFLLTVNVPPQLLAHPTSLNHSTGRTLVLPCVAHSASSLYWTRDGQKIISSENILNGVIERENQMFRWSALQLCGVGMAESGRYSCVAENEERSADATFYLCVTGPEPIGLCEAPSDTTIKMNETLRITCVGYTTLSSNTADLYWTRGDQKLHNNSAGVVIYEQWETGLGAVITSTLVIEPKDTARYGCHVTNDVITKKAEFTITVQVPPRIKNILAQYAQEEASYTCTAGGRPTPTIHWLKGNSPLSPDDDKQLTIHQHEVDEGFDEFEKAVRSILTVHKLEKTDAGVYWCVATNAAGTAKLNTSLVVNQSVVSGPGELQPSVAVGIGHASYLGAIVGFLCFLAVSTVYIVFRPLRKSPSTPSLVNLCLSLMALNLAYIISYNTTETEVGCILFAAVFQYFFFGAVLALMVFVGFKAQLKKEPTQRLFIYMIVFTLNWGSPIVGVIVSLTPDVSLYTQPETNHFCAPAQWSYWLGELLPFALLHIPTWCALIAISIINKSNRGRSEWLRDTISTTAILLLFDITWAIGLPTTQETNTVLQCLFVIFSVAFGVVFVGAYNFGDPEARFEIKNLLKKFSFPKTRTTPSSNKQTAPTQEEKPANVYATNPRVEMMSLDEELSLSGIEAGIAVQTQTSSMAQSRGIRITSFSDSTVDEGKVDLSENGCGKSPGRCDSVQGPEVVKVQNKGLVRYDLV